MSETNDLRGAQNLGDRLLVIFGVWLFNQAHVFVETVNAAFDDLGQRSFGLTFVATNRFEGGLFFFKNISRNFFAIQVLGASERNVHGDVVSELNRTAFEFDENCIHATSTLDVLVTVNDVARRCFDTYDFAEFDLPAPQVFRSAPLHYRLRAEFRLWHHDGRIDYAMFDSADPKQPILLETFPAAAAPIANLMPRLRDALQASEPLRRKIFQVDFLATLSGECLVSLIYHRPLDEAWEAAARALAANLGIQLIGRSRKQKIVLDRIRPEDGRDPLGRPRATSGPDFGEQVKVPDEIDVQRAREILDNWAASRAKFVKVFPTEYKRALSEIYERKVLQETDTPAVAAAKKVREATKEIYDYLETLKQELITQSNAKNEEGNFVNASLKNTEVPGNMFANNGKGEELKQKLNDYPQTIQGILSGLGITDVTFRPIARDASEIELFANDREAKNKSFVALNFVKSPVGAVIALISQFQNEVLNIESESLTTIANTIGSFYFKADITEAKISAVSNVVAAGTKFEGTMFIASSSSSNSSSPSSSISNK